MNGEDFVITKKTDKMFSHALLSRDCIKKKKKEKVTARYTVGYVSTLNLMERSNTQEYVSSFH